MNMKTDSGTWLGLVAVFVLALAALALALAVVDIVRGLF